MRTNILLEKIRMFFNDLYKKFRCNVPKLNKVKSEKQFPKVDGEVIQVYEQK